MVKKKKEGERDHAFCKNINTLYFTFFFAQLKKNSLPFNEKMAFLAVYKIGGQKTQCKLVPYQLLIKKGLTVASTLIFWEENLLYTNSDDAFLSH